MSYKNKKEKKSSSCKGFKVAKYEENYDVLVLSEGKPIKPDVKDIDGKNILHLKHV